MVLFVAVGSTRAEAREVRRLLLPCAGKMTFHEAAGQSTEGHPGQLM